MSFSGSYAADDVQFLLRRLQQVDFTDVANKEALIQSGQRHYSQMLSLESAPSRRYEALFEQACATNGARMARDCLRLADLIAQRAPARIALVSLARAGTPIGVIVTRLLRQRFGREVTHFSVSIVRDRGIDANALRHILARGFGAEQIVFVDGWTGKGVISRELARSVGAFNAQHGTDIDAGLAVLSDLSGSAALAASRDDYLIASSILNATVSGLVSRTVMDEAMGPDDFHGCVHYTHLAPVDRSRSFADAITALAMAAPLPSSAANTPTDEQAQARSKACIARLMDEHGVADVNLVKPGIGEATRVLLRRVPRLLLLRDTDSADCAHLRLLAQEKQVPIHLDPALPYHAVSLIRSAVDG